MKDLYSTLRNPRPKLPVDPLVQARVQDEFNAIARATNPIQRGMVWKAKVLRLQNELARLGYPLTPPPAKPSAGIDYARIMNDMRAVLKEQQPGVGPLPRKKVSSKELAKMLGVPLRTIQQWAQDGIITSAPINSVGRKRGRKVILFDVDKVVADLDRWERKAIGRT